jgi:hypothetical protein
MSGSQKAFRQWHVPKKEFTKFSDNCSPAHTASNIEMIKEPISICPRVFISNEIVSATLETLVLFNITGLVNAGFPQCDCHYMNVDDTSPNASSQASFRPSVALSYLPLSLDGSGEWRAPTIGPDCTELQQAGLRDQLDGFFAFAGITILNVPIFFFSVFFLSFIAYH